MPLRLTLPPQWYLAGPTVDAHACTVVCPVTASTTTTPVCAPRRSTQNCYALKVIDKHLVLRHKQMEYVRNERHVLDKTNYEGVVNLHFTFQDENSLYLGLELCPNGGVAHMWISHHLQSLSCSRRACWSRSILRGSSFAESVGAMRPAPCTRGWIINSVNLQLTMQDESLLCLGHELSPNCGCTLQGCSVCPPRSCHGTCCCAMGWPCRVKTLPRWWHHLCLVSRCCRQ